jgi:glycosyltransferase involved in cell wall biosynthesis
VIARHYERRGVRNLATIAYGAQAPATRGMAELVRLGVTSRQYILYVSRLEPENNADVVIRGFLAAQIPYDLVVVGDAPYADEYKAHLRRLAGQDSRIHFAGYVFGQGYDELRSHAAAYVQATDVGGTHPALLEAMAAGLPIFANDIAEHREVLADAGWYYALNSAESLAARFQEVMGPKADPQARITMAGRAKERVLKIYDWDNVTDDYEALAARLCDLRGGGGSGSPGAPSMSPVSVATAVGSRR